MPEQQDFSVNFFKPKTEAEKGNTRLISILVIIWAVTVFGFQFLLIGVGKPVEEQTLTDFRTLWPKVQEAPADTDLQSFARVMLLTLGKNTTIKEQDRILMEGALSVTVNLLDPGAKDSESAGKAIGLGSDGFDPLLKDQLAYHFKSTGTADYGSQSALPEAMEKYLIHNRSFLTDSTFLGFPFHYFYTAQFLLILFIVLCLIYAKVIDKRNARLGKEE